MHYICLNMPVHEIPSHLGSSGPSPVKYIKHCFEIREFVEIPHVKPDPPGNFPELKLAVTVLSLVEYARPVLKDAELAQKFTDIANEFIKNVSKDLPQGVSIAQRPAEKVKAA